MVLPDLSGKKRELTLVHFRFLPFSNPEWDNYTKLLIPEKEQ
jgi:hypothetical protein